MRKALSWLVVLASFALVSSGAPPETKPSVPSTSLGAGAFSPEYAWNLFLTLSAPLTGSEAKAWETSYRQTSSIYLSNGAKPSPWGTSTTPAEVSGAPAASGPCAATPTPWHDLDSTIQVDGRVLLDTWGQDVRYQLLMNRSAFDYILARGFYNVNGQERAAQQGRPANFPRSASELKTSWLWLGSDPDKCNAVTGKYYVVNAYYQKFDRDGAPAGWEVGRAALTGMHIINKQLPQWVWITFENVHNPQFTKIDLQLPLDPAVKAANATYQQRLRSIGSVFANYQLDFVQTSFTSSGQPTLAANSNIESAFQPVSSCITCHSLASIKPDGTYFNIVDTAGGGVNYYTGDPPSLKGFTRLDFVWSMKRASRAKK